VNPARPGAKGWQRLSGAFPTTGPLAQFLAVRGVKTPFLDVTDLYGACVEDAGRHYLIVADHPSLKLDAGYLNTSLGTHILDMQMALGNMVEAVRRRSQGLAQRVLDP
jgi:hypothetical protein